MDIEMFVLIDKNPLNFEINRLQPLPIAFNIVNTSSVKLLCSTSCTPFCISVSCDTRHYFMALDCQKMPFDPLSENQFPLTPV